MFVDDPEKFNDFEIVKTIRPGQMYEAVNMVTNKRVFIKKVHKNSIVSIKKFMKDLRGLPHLTTPFLYFPCQRGRDLAYSVQIFHELGSLFDFLGDLRAKFGRGCNEKQARSIMKSLLLGISSIHEKKLHHGEIKLSHVLLTKKGEVSLCCHFESKQPGVYKSPYWMSPEEIMVTGRDRQKHDIWSLGITLYELIERYPPYYEEVPMQALFSIVQHDSSTFKDPSKWSNEMNDFLAKCLEKDSEKRRSVKTLLSHDWIQGGEREENFDRVLCLRHLIWMVTGEDWFGSDVDEYERIKWLTFEGAVLNESSSLPVDCLPRFDIILRENSTRLSCLKLFLM